MSSIQKVALVTAGFAGLCLGILTISPHLKERSELKVMMMNESRLQELNFNSISVKEPNP